MNSKSNKSQSPHSHELTLSIDRAIDAGNFASARKLAKAILVNSQMSSAEINAVKAALRRISIDAQVILIGSLTTAVIFLISVYYVFKT